MPRKTYLKMDSILVLGSWNLRKTLKTRIKMSGLGERNIDQYAYLSTIPVISNTCQINIFLIRMAQKVTRS